MNEPHRLRWLALFVFTLASALSFIDRQLLALAPVIQSEFGLTLAQYGTVVSFSAYADGSAGRHVH